MNRFTLDDSFTKTNRTRKTKRWLGWLTFCMLFFVGQIGFSQTYCIPTYTDGCAGFGDDINDFVVANTGISHIGSGCSPDSYGDFTATIDLFGSFQQGETYEFTATHNYGSGQWIAIYIDFNEDGDFDDADELLFVSTAGSTNGVTTGTFIIPLTVPLTSSTRLRVIDTYGEAPMDACTGAWYGETHDYSIEILPPPICPTPNQLGANINTLTEAELYWTSSGTLFEVEYGAQGFALGSGTLVDNITTNSTTLSGLTANTFYQYYVRLDCGVDGYSIWAGPYTFYTNYCEVSTQWTGDNINGFETSGAIVNISNTNNGSAPTGYDDFTSFAVQHFETGEAEFTVTTQWSMNVNIWIDWNNNMTFDASELVYEGLNEQQTHTALITVPVGTPLGDYRIRIRAGYLWNGSIVPCGISTYGETEDYTFTVITPPTCMPPTQLGASINSLTEAELYWTSDGTLFEVEYGTQGFTLGTGTSVDNITTTSTTISGLTANTFYHYFVRRDCGSGDLSPWAGPYTFYTNYCVSTTQYQWDYINGFETSEGITNISNNNTGFSPNGYGDYTAMSVSHFETGEVNFTLTTPSWLGVNIWVDWNNNMVFEESEKVYTSGDFTMQGPFTGTFSVPVGQAVGDYRMRVRGSNDSGNPSPCGQINYGETEDYTFTVIPTPTCLPPAQLGATINSLTEAELFWTSTGTLFEVEYGTQGFTLGTGTPVTGITTNSTTLSGLTANTYYHYFVRRDCGGGDFSPWMGPYTFYTNYCEAFTQWTGDNISGFETSGAIINISNSNNGSAPTGYADFTSFAVQHFETGEVDFTVTTQWSMNVNMWIDWNNNMVFDAGELVYEGLAQQTTHTVTITVPTGTPVGDYRIRIRAGYLWNSNIVPCGMSNYGETEDYTFTVITPPTCMPPTQLGANINTLTEAELYWTSDGTLFEVEYGAQGFALGTGTTVTGITTNSTTLSGLTQNTYYHYFVRRDCGGGDVSPWTGPYTFYTNYCEVSTQWTGDNISGFETSGAIINVSNSNNGSAPTGYADFTSFAVQHFETGETEFTVTTQWSMNVNIWIDWNNNMTFDAGELVYEGLTEQTTHTALISVPVGTPLGDYRIRIRAGYLWNSNIVPCGMSNYGETEDYTFTVITPPTCMPPTQLGANINTLTEAELYWTSDGTLFEVEYGAQGFALGTGTTVTGITTNSTTLSGLTANTYYHYFVRRDCGSGDLSPWTGPYKFYTNYCESTSQYQWDYITSFETSGGIPFDISNTSSGASPNGYGDFTSMSVHHFETGQVDFTIETTWSGMNVNMWIDWNNNMVFEEDELVASTYTGSFLIPIGTPVGDYRIRIRAGSSSPCGTINYGETEDYTLTVITPPDCLPPFVPIAANISATAVSLSWQADGDVFDIEYGPTGFTPGTGTMIPGVGNPYILGPLVGGQTYDYYVRQDCNADEDGYSTWNGPVTFTPGVFEGNIPTLLNADPQVEDFACATSFAIDVPDGQFLASLQVQYVMTSANPAYTSHQRSVLYSSTLGMGEAAVALPTGGEDFPGVIYYNRAVTFANGATGTIEFELKAWRTTGGSGCGENLVFVEDGTWVLNATFEDIPACPNPATDLGYANPTADSVDLVWTSAEAGTFQVKWGNVGFNVETEGTEISDIDAFSYTLSGLDSTIPYDFYVRRDCSTDDEDEFGEWAGPVRFNSGHCIPYATQGFYFTLFNTTNAVENVTYSYPDTALGTGYVDNMAMIITEDAGETFNFTSNFVGGASGLRIWVDWNNDFIFGDDEQVFFLAGGTGNKSGTITIPADTPGGDYRMRVRAQTGATANPPACGLVAQGEALDFTLRVSCDEVATPTGLATQQFTVGQTLADLDVTGDNLVWYADEDLTIVLDPSTELVDATIYYVVSTNGGCQSDYLAVTVEQTSGVADFNNFGFRYYPNPVTDMMYLSANTPISNVTVINMLGQEVNVPANSDNTSLDMSGLPTGNYLIKVTIEGVSKMLKVVKK